MLKQAYGRGTISRTQAFEWHRCFREGSESVEDDECSGPSQTYHPPENIDKVSATVRTELIQNSFRLQLLAKKWKVSVKPNINMNFEEILQASSTIT
ncbi:hypothetical protein TNCV_2979231 [Trichonephila clavipes]|nr:hypothetical protein TNCV_2979231 [Trichonephila clavipes]